MKNTILFVLLVMLVSCSEELTTTNETDENKSLVKSDSVKVDTKPLVEIDTLVDSYAELINHPMYFLPEEVEILKNYFSDSTIVIYDSCQVLLAEAKTDTDFGIAYIKLLSVRTHLGDEIYSRNFPDDSNGIYYPDYLLEGFKPIDDAVMGIQSDCVAECTEFDFTLDLKELKPLTLKTEGELDDLLFEIFDLTDGDYGGTGFGWHNWFVRTWDYGGGSLFGTGIHLDLLKKINALKVKTTIYNDLLQQYQNNLLHDIQHGTYMKTQAETTEELKTILNLKFLSSEEKASLQLLLGNWEKGDGTCKNCVAGFYQFGCETGDCDWGG